MGGISYRELRKTGRILDQACSRFAVTRTDTGTRNTGTYFVRTHVQDFSSSYVEEVRHGRWFLSSLFVLTREMFVILFGILSVLPDIRESR